MEYSMFSTSPGAAGAGGAGGNGGYNNLGSVHAFGTGASADSGNANLNMGFNTGGNLGAGRNNMGSPNPMSTRPTAGGLNNNNMIFSTTPQPMNANGGNNIGAFGNVYMSTGYTLDIDNNAPLNSNTTANSLFEMQSLNPLMQQLNFLQDINENKHIVRWGELIDPEHPSESAKKIQETLAKSKADRSTAAADIAAAITLPAHLSVVNALEDSALQSDIRNRVLQELLDQLTFPGSQQPMSPAAEMLAEMSRLNLVRLSGVVAVVDQFLADPEKRRAGISVLGRVAEQNRGSEAFMKEIHEKANIEQVLLNLYKDPEYEYDVVAITRLLGGEAAMRSAVGLRPVTLLKQESPVTVIQYFRGRDELLSAQVDGTVAVYGAPNASGDVVARETLDVFGNCTPVGITGPRSGQYAAVAAVPVSNQHLSFVEERKRNGGGSKVAASSNNSVVQLLSYSESNHSWGLGEVIQRPGGITATAIAALSATNLCLAESGTTHDVTLINPSLGTATGTIANAHSDFITVLSPGENEFSFVSGGRDKVVKLWDSRKSGTATVVATLDNTAHTDTISCIHSFHNYLLTGSLDGSLLIWDTRRLETPIAPQRNFSSPVLGLSIMDGKRTAVATARCLYLISLESLGCVDVTPNVCYSSLITNDKGNIAFAIGEEGVQVLGLRQRS